MLFSFKIEDQDASQYGHDSPRIAWLPRDPQYPNRPRHRSAVEVRRRQHRRRPAELVRREHLDLHQPLRANTRRSLSDDVRTGRCRILLLAVLGTQTVATLIAKKLYSED